MSLTLFISISLPTTSARKEPRFRPSWCQSNCVSGINARRNSSRLQGKPGIGPSQPALHNSIRPEEEAPRRLPAVPQQNTTGLVGRQHSRSPKPKDGGSCSKSSRDRGRHRQKHLVDTHQPPATPSTYTTDEGCRHLVPFSPDNPARPFLLKSF